jgi:hypothetical protein
MVCLIATTLGSCAAQRMKSITGLEGLEGMVQQHVLLAQHGKDVGLSGFSG